MLYTYDPKNITDDGSDRMRFELGDTDVSGDRDTSALCDEEYVAIIEKCGSNWNRAKLQCVESILRRFSYEVDTKVGPLTLNFSQRISAWQALRDELKREVSACNAPIANKNAIRQSHYFYPGMQQNGFTSSERGGI